MAYQFALAYPVDDGFVIEAPPGGLIGQTFTRGAESWEIIRIFSLGYVIVSNDPELWPTPNVDYELT
jgi:hypothetical protein